MKSKLNSREQDNIGHKTTTINSNLKFDYGKGRQKVQLVGIVNVTPDSFFDGGKYDNPQKAIDHGKALLDAGADWLDIGGESTRPFATAVEESEEIKRVLPVVEGLAHLAPISIDTRKSGVARLAIEAGATMINDVSGFIDPKMCELAASSNVLCCITHSQGSPETMQLNPTYPNGLIPQISSFFKEQIATLACYGVEPHRLILDPGIGFGKTVDHCFEIIRKLDQLQALGFPLYLGISRKSFLQKTLGKTADQLLHATLICDTVCALAGVAYLRVHDVKEHFELLTLVELLQE